MVASSGPQIVAAGEGKRFVGTWKLIDAVSEELATGQKTNVYAAAPLGFINFGADGRFIVMVVDSSRVRPATDVPTASEAEALFRSMAAYAGSYVVNEDRLINYVDISWNEIWTGTEQLRAYRFDGERLHLSTNPSPNPFTGRMSIRTLSWERVKMGDACQEARSDDKGPVRPDGSR
jgi:hypothetical protein